MVWAIAAVLLPAPLAARVFLLAPLVIVPRLLVLFPDRRWVTRIAGWPALIAAVPLVVSFGLPVGGLAGTLAGALGLPWLAIALTAAIIAAVEGLGRLTGAGRLAAIPELGVDAALGFWAIGAIFVVVDRLGTATPFPTVIVLLTATHFHFAGLGLLGLASLLARSRPWLRASVVGLLVGIPLTALGFVLATNLVNSIGAGLVGLAGIGVGLALLTQARPGRWRWASRLAGAALLVSMPLAIGWSLAILTGQPFLDLDAMIRSHGELNALAVLLGIATSPAQPRSASALAVPGIGTA
jgi:hypothetical protein